MKEKTFLEVLFEDGITKRYDILSLSDQFPQLLALKNRELFLKGHLLGWGGVVWNDELDVESETIYEDGITVENNDNVQAIILGFRIKEMRKKEGLTQQELSIRSGVPQADISRIEQGQLNPSIQFIQKIAKGMNKNVSIEFIWERKNASYKRRVLFYF